MPPSFNAVQKPALSLWGDVDRPNAWRLIARIRYQTACRLIAVPLRSTTQSSRQNCSSMVMPLSCTSFQIFRVKRLGLRRSSPADSTV
jgi:hypothetical protein